MLSTELTYALRTRAESLGFCFTGACAAVEPPRFGRLQEWLQAGYAGHMHYMADRQEAYRHPKHVLDGVRSLLVLAMNYHSVEPEPADDTTGQVSRYAWGTDYHDVIRTRLRALADYHRSLTPEASIRGVVDTAPLMEREFAVLAGLGWIGKNTLLLTRECGSWLFLAVLLTTAVLEYDEPFAAEYCGTCRACIDACPTDALVEPYVLDARRCLSYLTIELRGMPEMDLRPATENWLFGCDICQEVCPWNQHRARAPDDAPVNREFLPLDGATSIDLAELFTLDDTGFRERFHKTPLWRAKRRGLLRTAAMILGNRRVPEAAPTLLRGLNDNEPIVRAASVWALGRLTDVDLSEPLQRRLQVEEAPEVREEILRSISATRS
jgi:epoxyqueuosine reductase